MHLQAIYLQSFRNVSKAYLEFFPGLNVLYGANAQGKTNLLEAIYFLITGQSFRTHKLEHLIQEGKPYLSVEALFNKNGVKQRLHLVYDGKKRYIQYNKKKFTGIKSLLGLLSGEVISPEDRMLVKGGPKLRRKFLDLRISLLDPLYIYHLNRFYKAIHHRNAMLKGKKIEGGKTRIDLFKSHNVNCKY